MTRDSDPSAFQHRVDALLRDLLTRFDDVDPDQVEAEATEGVLKLTFADGSRCVLNRQSAAHQVWLAEGATAWHFNFDEAANAWIDTKGRGHLRTILADVLARRLGRRLELG